MRASAACARPGDGRVAGFTLVEVMAALALAAIVALLLMYGVGLATRGLDRLSQHADRFDERRSLEMLMRRALDAAVAVPSFAGEPGFVGRPTRIAFFSAVDDGGPGVYRITLALDAGRSPPAVMLARRPAGKSAVPGGGESTVVRDVRSFGILYFGALSPGTAPRWHRRWEGMARLPELVQIEFGTADGVQPPPIILRVPDGG